MPHALLALLLRFAPTRWLWAIAVTTLAFVRALPRALRQTSADLKRSARRMKATAPRRPSESDRRVHRKAAWRRAARGRSRWVREQRTRLGQLHGQALGVYLQALRDLSAKGEEVSATRKAMAHRVTTMPLHLIRKADAARIINAARAVADEKVAA